MTRNASSSDRADAPALRSYAGRISQVRPFAVVKAVFAVGAITILGVAPSSCQTGGIGDPCIPEDEYRGDFSGFQVSQENIESRSFQCESRICLVNHFQGRVSCPLGQAGLDQPGGRELCAAPDSSCSEEGESCAVSATFAPTCTAETAEQNCASDICNDAGFCECSSNADCPENYICDDRGGTDDDGNANIKACKLFVCHNPDNCQDSLLTNEQNAGKLCCVPGNNDVPVADEVCGQCEEEGLRNAANAVYCSCRCGVAEGQPEDENFNFCECPDGFECAEVRPDVGLGDTQLTGKYCVKADDPIINDEGKIDPSAASPRCGDIVGFKGMECAGVPATGGGG